MGLGTSVKTLRAPGLLFAFIEIHFFHPHKLGTAKIGLSLLVFDCNANLSWLRLCQSIKEAISKSLQCMLFNNRQQPQINSPAAAIKLSKLAALRDAVDSGNFQSY
jgi:hypothetical protein